MASGIITRGLGTNTLITRGYGLVSELISVIRTGIRRILCFDNRIRIFQFDSIKRIFTYDNRSKKF